MSNLIFHAKNELDAIGMGEDSSEINLSMRNHLLNMVTEFSKEGHSGFSASYAISLLSKLLNFEQLCPLTGDDSEWVEVAEVSGYPLYQNKREGRVFKEQGVAYDTSGIVFYDIIHHEDGNAYMVYFTDGNSRVKVIFPYTPKTIYKEREAE